ncbi:hypothetical protein ACFWHX_13445, partial [Streptomyces hirsutus]
MNDPALPWKKTVKLRGIEAPTVLPVALDIEGGPPPLGRGAPHITPKPPPTWPHGPHPAPR